MKKILIGVLGVLIAVGGIAVGEGMAVTISGYVTSGGSGVKGVVMNGLPGTPTPSTNDLGYYSAEVDSNWSGIVKPQKIGYAIFPFSTEYVTISSDQLQQDYTAVLLPKVALFMQPTTYNLGDPINITMTLENQGSDFFTSQGFKATNFALFLQFTDPDNKLITSNYGVGNTPGPPSVVHIETVSGEVKLIAVDYVEKVPTQWVLSMSFNIFDHNYYTLSKGGNYSVKARISVRAYLSDDVFQTNPPPYAPHDAGSSGDIESNIVNFAIISLSTVDHITISPASSTIVAGRSQAYATQAFDVYNNSTDVTPQTLTISPNGSCSGNACTATVAGPHSVQATYSGKTATANLQVIPGGAAKLAFGVQPSNTTVGVTISPPITVQIVDSNGNLITSSTAPVTLGIGNNPGGGTLSGTKKRNAINGVATFNDLSINKVGNGYTLVAASSSGLTGTTSSTFNITAKTYLLTVTKAGTGSGNVTASPGPLVWNGNVGTATYNAGTPVTLTASANTGSTFTGWSASCSGTGNCSTVIIGSKATVNMCGPCNATATFRKK